jgi:diketogulonate reductase-like aldo/keto reductase
MSTSQLSPSSRIKLNNRLSMPRIHLGVYRTSGPETENAVRWALQASYRGVDSAEWYANECEVGSPIRFFLHSPENVRSLNREDVWFTTKLKTNTSYDATRKSIKKSLKECGFDYIDLYLLHSPYGGRERRLECWRAVEDAIR